jgi:hypothetical protein
MAISFTNNCKISAKNFKSTNIMDFESVDPELDPYGIDTELPADLHIRYF